MIIFTQHAILKLKHRYIPKELVIDAVKHPDQMMQSYRDRKIVYKKLKKIYLKVIFRKEKENIIVITQHLTDKII